MGIPLCAGLEVAEIEYRSDGGGGGGQWLPHPAGCSWPDGAGDAVGDIAEAGRAASSVRSALGRKRTVAGGYGRGCYAVFGSGKFIEGGDMAVFDLQRTSA